MKLFRQTCTTHVYRLENVTFYNKKSANSIVELPVILVSYFVLHVLHNKVAYWKGISLFVVSTDIKLTGVDIVACFTIHTFPECKSIILLIQEERYIKPLNNLHVDRLGYTLQVYT